MMSRVRGSSPGPCVAVRCQTETVDFTPREIDAEHAQRYVAEGFWDDQTLGGLLADGLHDAASQPFTVRSERRPYRGTLGDVDTLARRVASGMRARGVQPGDAVAFQLPNWLEAAATFYAVAYLGAVVVPIVHFYGSKEVLVHPGPHAREGISDRGSLRSAGLPRESRDDAVRFARPGVGVGGRW